MFIILKKYQGAGGGGLIYKTTRASSRKAMAVTQGKPTLNKTNKQTNRNATKWCPDPSFYLQIYYLDLS